MKIYEFFKVLVFPFRIQSPGSGVELFRSESPFFDEPAYSKNNEGFWSTLKKEGQYTCPSGYTVIVKMLSDQNLLVVHGLKVSGKWRSQGRTDGLSIVADKDKTKSYIDEVVAAFEAQQALVDDQVKALVTDNVHEIRSLNTSLYHAAYQLQSYVINEKLAADLSKNVVALSELIAARIQFADLTASRSSEAVNDNLVPVGVYKKFDKMVRCYIAYARKREISILISGESKSLALGVDNFEMVPLVVIDNAVKYSPNRKGVAVDFMEDATSITCKVASYGPQIKDSEKEKIFERAVRADSAIFSGRTGGGIGLYYASKLMAAMKAKIEVEQDANDRFQDSGKLYFRTAFIMTFVKVIQKHA